MPIPLPWDMHSVGHVYFTCDTIHAHKHKVKSPTSWWRSPLRGVNGREPRARLGRPSAGAGAAAAPALPPLGQARGVGGPSPSPPLSPSYVTREETETSAAARKVV